tara:strand:+ start:870 stop:1226 length:357 start_codon:yes stop_codon:yes gene_type:complete
MEKLPNFVMMSSKYGDTTALRLTHAGSSYYRDGGDWAVSIYLNDIGQIFSRSCVPSVDNFELVPTTEKKWRESNGYYAPTNFKKCGYDFYEDLLTSKPCAEIALPEEKEKENYMYLLI